MSGKPAAKENTSSSSFGVPSSSSSTNNAQDRSKNGGMKRKRSGWLEQPAFLDASATVSASIFGARRLPELKSLYRSFSKTKKADKRQHNAISGTTDKEDNNVVDPVTKNPRVNNNVAKQRSDQFLLSGGGKTSSRHLRRRTTNLNSRKRHRYPSGHKLSPSSSSSQTVENAIDQEEDKSSASLELNQEQQRDGETHDPPTEMKNTMARKKTRKAKRSNRSTLCAAHYDWQAFINDDQRRQQQRQDDNMEKSRILMDKETKDSLPSSAVIHSKPHQKQLQLQLQPVQWMTTHLWHAKRFHMEDLWGWKVPLVHTNRGARAILRLTTPSVAQTKQQKQQQQQQQQDPPKSWIQDVSWQSQPLVVRARQLEILVTAMQRLCPGLLDSPSHHHPNTLLCGSSIGEGVLYGIDEFPRGAIGPAMWRIVYTDEPSSPQPQPLNCKNMATGMWEFHVWMHPSIRKMVRRCLEQLVPQYTQQLECLGNLPGGMSRLSLRGAHATATVCQVLSPSSASSGSKEKSHCPLHWDWDKLFETVGASDDADHDHESYQNIMSQLPHGAMFSVQVQLNEEEAKAIDPSPSTSARTANSKDALAEYISLIQTTIGQWDPTQASETDLQYPRQMSVFHPDSSRVLLVWQRPRDPGTCPSNQAVCGWDIICSPQLGTQLWHTITSSSCKLIACPIGIVEHAHLLLECHPPLPLFPRDYVDTVQGQLYWQGTTTPLGHTDSVTRNEWHTVRRLWEGGWGRLRMPKKVSNGSATNNQKELKRLNWETLMLWNDESSAGKDDTNKDDQSDEEKPSDDASEPTDDLEEEEYHEEPSVVVVRGSFGQPFCDALAACGTMASLKTAPSSEEEVTSSQPRRRRKHRRVRPRTEMAYAMPLSKERGNQFSAMCQTLRQSLTLPAVLFCHITLPGPGTIVPGSPLFAGVHTTTVAAASGMRNIDQNNNNEPEEEEKDEPFLIGVTTAGGFSYSRGCCHGVGILGAARLLQALEQSATVSGRRGTLRFAAIAQQEPRTTQRHVQEIQLLVTLQNGPPGTEVQRSATLSLIL
jgi:Ribonucleases P/MRP protein subunit POP1